MKHLLNIIALFALSTGLVSCGLSSQEKEQRRANAFDIAGKYKINADQTTPNEVVLDIRNEGDRSNVFGVIDRSDFFKEEENAFSRQNISLNDVEKFRTHFQIGVGLHNRIEGGENISDDMGISSRLLITTNESEALKIDSNTINYYVVATMQKNDFTLRGKIVMTIEHMEVSQDKTTWTITEKVETPFIAKNNTSFFHQYAGIWSGQMITDSGILSNALSSITIRELDDVSFEIYSSLSSFVLDDEKFILSNNKKHIDELAKIEFPEIYFEFIGNKGSKIAVMGNLYSLGMYSGVVAKIASNGSNEQIGNFQFKRK